MIDCATQLLCTTLMVWLLDLRHVSFFCYTFIILAASNVFANELDVYEAITANYNKNVRPVRNFSEPVVVSVELVYFNLLGMVSDSERSLIKGQKMLQDQIQETITFETNMELIWKDEYIGWNASEVGGTAAVVIPYDLLWKPDIYVSTGLSVEYKMPDEQRFVNVLSDGTVRLLKPCLITNRCALSIEAFPYDVQTCNIILDSWMYSTDQVDLVVGKKRRNMNSTINDGYFVGNGEWTLVSFDKALELTNASSGRQFPDVTYTVKLRRQPIYYICVLLIPTFVTATICLFGLFVPAMNTGERVEKVNMGLATLLSMAIILGIVAGEMPKTTTLPLLGFYVLAELILCTIGIIVSMVIMVVHQRASTRVLIPPRWLNTILFLKMKSLQEPEKTDVTTGDTEKVSQPLSKDKAMIDLFENIKNSIFAQRLNQVLDRVEEHIDDKEFEDYILLQWIIIFDRIDMLFLVLFNTVNIVMPIILFKY